jgi:Lon protease-like protein
MPDQTTTLTVPLFPLPNVVFFPKTFLPLHIFEPRYRAMVRDASQHDQLIGMVLLKEGWEREYEGAPAVHAVGCAGKIIALDLLPDGRSNIILYGLSRFTIESETTTKSYREAQVKRDTGERWRRLSKARKQDLLDTVQRIAERQPLPQELSALMQIAGDPEVLVNLLCSELPLTVVEKQFLLESSTLDQRARRLVELVELQSV